MKKFSLFALIIISVFTLCGCSTDFACFAPQQTSAQPANYYTVYVFGAVQNEGYYSVRNGADLSALVRQAGYLPQTYLSSPNLLVAPDRTLLAVEYLQDGKVFSCVNVNGLAVANRLQFENIDSEIINRIADHLSSHGKITDKSQLKEILGETDYLNNYYKFYVSWNDHEKAC